MIFIYFYWCLLPRYECFGGCALTDSFSLPQKAMAENQTQPPDGTLNPSACFFLSLTWKIWWELDRDMAVMGGLEVEFLKWRSAPWSRLTTYFDNPQSREAGSIDGIDGIDGIDRYRYDFEKNWHKTYIEIWIDMIWKAEKPLRRCSVQMLVTQDVFWPGTVHNGWVGGCWKRHIGSRWGCIVGCVCIRSWEIHMSCLLLFRRSNKGWLYVIIQHWCIHRHRRRSGIDVPHLLASSPVGCRGERAKNMSRDHKPELKSERNRIYKATWCEDFAACRIL